MIYKINQIKFGGLITILILNSQEFNIYLTSDKKYI